MKRYLTTPIYYASGAPHLGHAYTTLLAACFKRYYALRGDDVTLATGTDEHGQKIERAAVAAGQSTADFVDARSHEFEQLWRKLDIHVELFERTTSTSHQTFATQFWNRLVDSGDVYLDEYRGLYCVDCEQYFGDGEETCPIHRRPLETFTEPSYFFRLSRYRPSLIDHIEAHGDFIVPGARRNEMLAFLKGHELRDIAISRTSTRWGVPVPGDHDHVMYVWVDALVTYLSALSIGRDLELENESIQSWWANTSHFIGKDILTFHAVYWPALLLSARLPLPKRLIVNGWLTVEGRKVAKSDPATVVDPAVVSAQVGSDGLKLYFLKTVALGQDVNYSHDHLVQTVNSDLANNIGNLFSRFISLSQSACNGEWCAGSRPEGSDASLHALVRGRATEIEQAFAEFNPARAARAFVDAAAGINAWTQQAEPWRLPDPARRATVLWTLHHALADLTILGTPFVPQTAAKARDALCLTEPASWGQLGVRREVVRTRRVPPLYPRVDGQ